MFCGGGDTAGKRSAVRGKIFQQSADSEILPRARPAPYRLLQTFEVILSLADCTEFRGTPQFFLAVPTRVAFSQRQALQL